MKNGSGPTLPSQRRPARRIRRQAAPALHAGLAAAFLASPAGAAEKLLFRGATVHTVSGETLAPGEILVEGGRIAAVAKHLEASGATVVDLSGKTLVPGLVDARSCLYLPDVERRDRGAADWNVLDSLASFSDDHERAWQGGVTTAYISPGTFSTFAGRGAVLKLRSTAVAADRVLRADAALEVLLRPEAEGRSTSISRQSTFLSVRRAFLDAREYRKAWERYREELAEYETHKKEDKGEKKEVEESARKREETGGKEEPPRPEKTEPPKEAAKRDGAAPERRPKKPRKPKEDPAKEALVQALEGKIPVRIDAEHADEILYALRLAEDFDLHVILDGAGEGSRVLPELAGRSVPVVFGPVLRSSAPSVRDLWLDPATPVRLAAASVPVAIASGATTRRATRFLAFQASLAAGLGMDRRAALRSITLTAAEALGVADRVGSLDAGKDADLVVLDGDPLDTRSRVERVYVEGRLVYPSE